MNPVIFLANYDFVSKNHNDIDGVIPSTKREKCGKGVVPVTNIDFFS